MIKFTVVMFCSNCHDSQSQSTVGPLVGSSSANSTNKDWEFFKERKPCGEYKQTISPIVIIT